MFLICCKYYVHIHYTCAIMHMANIYNHNHSLWRLMHSEPTLTHLPKPSPQSGGRCLKVQHEAQSPEEGLVNILNEVCGEDDDAWEPLYVVEENSHINISIAISGCAGGGVTHTKNIITLVNALDLFFSLPFLFHYPPFLTASLLPSSLSLSLPPSPHGSSGPKQTLCLIKY